MESIFKLGDTVRIKVEPGVLRAGTETPSGTSLPTSDKTSRPLKLVTKRYNVKLNFKN